MTILIMSVVILWYSNYVLPAFEKQKAKELQEQQLKAKQLEAYQKREAEIELSQRLHKDTKWDYCTIEDFVQVQGEI